MDAWQDVPWALFIGFTGAAVSYGVMRAQLTGVERRLDRVESRMDDHDETLTEGRAQFAEIRALMVSANQRLEQLHEDLRALQKTRIGG